jgi:hypothetical protein
MGGFDPRCFLGEVELLPEERGTLNSFGLAAAEDVVRRLHDGGLLRRLWRTAGPVAAAVVGASKGERLCLS